MRGRAEAMHLPRDNLRQVEVNFKKIHKTTKNSLSYDRRRAEEYIGPNRYSLYLAVAPQILASS